MCDAVRRGVARCILRQRFSQRTPRAEQSRADHFLTTLKNLLLCSAAVESGVENARWRRRGPSVLGHG